MLGKLKLKLLSLSGDPAAQLVNLIIASDATNIGVYGMGDIGQDVVKLSKTYCTRKIEFFLFDSKAEHHPFSIQGTPVVGPKCLSGVDMEEIYIASVKFKEDIRELLSQQCDLNTTKIVLLE